MMKCKEASQLMSQGLDRPLGLGERIGLRLHLLICSGCRAVRHQLSFIRNVCAEWRDRGD